MARQRQEPEPTRPNLEPDAIVERAADTGAAAGSQPLSGFLGRGTEGGRWRLYETPALDSYYEFDEGDVVHSVKHEGELGGTTVWLRSGAPIAHTVVSSTAAQQSFLQGPISSAATHAAAAAAAPQVIWPTRLECTWGLCPSNFFYCRQTWWNRCGSWIDACGSWICLDAAAGNVADVRPVTRQIESCFGDCGNRPPGGPTTHWLGCTAFFVCRL
jgi:hypothetical protein